mgnify:CR=1 FL=1
MKIKFAVGIGRNEKITEISELAQLADEKGFSHMTLVDAPGLSRDVHVMATIAAMSTRRIGIGHGVVDPYTHHPLVIANAAASLHELTGGRAFLGLGAGGSFGKIMKPVRNKELREAVLFAKKFMSGEEAEFKGAKIKSEWIGGPVPIYLGADNPMSLQLAGEVADGVYFMGGPPELIKWKVDHVYRGAEKVGRDPTKIDICVRSYIYVTDSKEDAKRELSGHVPFHYEIFERHKNDSAIANLARTLEGESPGILDEMKRYSAALEEFRSTQGGFDPWFEKIDAPYSVHMTQRIIDKIHQVGSVDQICTGIEKLAEVGVTTIATATYVIIDKHRMLQDIATKIMPNFRN